MPFLGKDWRSSGEQWVRTEHGWERSRMLECLLDSLNVGYVIVFILSPSWFYVINLNTRM